MSKFKTCLTGIIAGVATTWVALQFHVVRSEGGFFLIPRETQAQLSHAWADVRTWTPADWAEHPELVQALHKNGSTDIIGDSGRDSVRDSVLERLAPVPFDEDDSESSRAVPGSDSVRPFLDGFGSVRPDSPDPDAPLPPIAETPSRGRYARSEEFESGGGRGSPNAPAGIARFPDKLNTEPPPGRSGSPARAGRGSATESLSLSFGGIPTWHDSGTQLSDGSPDWEEDAGDFQIVDETDYQSDFGPVRDDDDLPAIEPF